MLRLSAYDPLAVLRSRRPRKTVARLDMDADTARALLTESGDDDGVITLMIGDRHYPVTITPADPMA